MNLKDILQSNLGDELEFTPIVPIGETEMGEEDKKKLPKELPIIALRNTVLFPNVVLPITVARDKSLQAVNDAIKNNNSMIGVAAQIDGSDEDPGIDDIFRTGTVAKIIKQIKLPDGNTTLFIMGRMRFEIDDFTQTDPYLKAAVTYKEDEFPTSEDKEFEAMISTIKDMAERMTQLAPNLQIETGLMLKNVESNSFLIHFIASNLSANLYDKQNLLATHSIKDRTNKLIELLVNDLNIAELKNEISNKTRGEMDKQQREYFLQQQMKSIKDELGGDSNEKEIEELKKRAKSKKWNEKIAAAFVKDTEKLERMHPSTPDYSIVYNHAELLLDLPWNEYTEDKIDLKKSLKVLDADHYGMEKIKERILEYLAVLKLKGDLKSPILCFVGPPGIGKTSLAHSIANAINRKFVRLSLGGLSDESELRGHRKTYIGAMPGRIIQSIKKVNTANPVFILDEIDKMAKDFRGDPSAAMLEILDPEQNHSFYDNYLEQEFDLSKVLFIATANSLSDIPGPLRDRMEIINLSGYAVEEKIEIAKKHLIPKQKKAHGIENVSLQFSSTVISKLIQEYTRESGVRDLDRKIAGVMRNVAKRVAMEEDIPKTINSEIIKDALGSVIFLNEISEKNNVPGVVVGLAWTAVGGDILYIEASTSKGKGNLTLTGNLGDVMKESATTALSYIKAHATALDIDEDVFDKINIHVHVPEGAVPKDGPSAGITMLTALTSAIKGKKVIPHLAMTGEITLRGQVLPVGGIKEKILAAKRAGIKDIIMCHLNERDVVEINPNFIKGVRFHYVKEMEEVLNIALSKK